MSIRHGVISVTAMLGAALCLAGYAPVQAQPAPNIVVLMADDLGWTQNGTNLLNDGNADVAFGYDTPNLTRLAQQGVSFTSAYAQPACVATRVALLTGQNSVNNGVYANRSGGVTSGGITGVVTASQMQQSAVSMAERFQSAGYATGIFGKGHAGDTSGNGGDFVNFHGFDVNLGADHSNGPTDGSKYFADANGFHTNDSGGTTAAPALGGFVNNTTGLPVSRATVGATLRQGDGYVVGSGDYWTDAQSGVAIDFMNNANDANSGAGQAFFTYVPYFGVHWPIPGQAPANLITQFAAADNPTYAAMIYSFDQSVGQILDYLEQTDDPRNAGHKLIDNTMVVFTTDNGGNIQPSIFGATGDTPFNGPLRGGKGEYYEGGVRVPFAVRYDPLTAGQEGETRDDPVHVIDIYSTAVEAAGIGAPDPLTHKLDGFNLSSLLDGDVSNDQAFDGRGVFWHHPGIGSNGATANENRDPITVVRKGDWKMTYNYLTSAYELYNLVDDLGETTNRINDETALTAATDLSTTMRQWLIDNNAPLPTLEGTSTEVPLPFVVTEVPGGTTLNFTDDFTDAADWNLVEIQARNPGGTATISASSAVINDVDNDGKDGLFVSWTVDNATQGRYGEVAVFLGEATIDLTAIGGTIDSIDLTVEQSTPDLTPKSRLIIEQDGTYFVSTTEFFDSVTTLTALTDLSFAELLISTTDPTGTDLDTNSHPDFSPTGGVLNFGIWGFQGATAQAPGSSTTASFEIDQFVLDLLVQISLPGDYNGNGIVDTADYTIWRDTLGSMTDLRADGDGSGTVDAGDYAFWKTRFGNTADIGSLVAAAVPEPGSITLLVGLGALVLRWRHYVAGR